MMIHILGNFETKAHFISLKCYNSTMIPNPLVKRTEEVQEETFLSRNSFITVHTDMQNSSMY